MYVKYVVHLYSYVCCIAALLAHCSHDSPRTHQPQYLTLSFNFIEKLGLLELLIAKNKSGNVTLS